MTETAFTARLNTRVLDIGTRLSLTPVEPTNGPPRPELRDGTVVATETSDGDTIALFVCESTTVDGLTRDFVVRRPDGRLFRLGPQKPGEGGGYWEPDRGMTVWVVRWQVEG